MSLGALGGSERLFDLFRVTEGKDYIRGSIHYYSYEGNISEVSKWLEKKTDIDELDFAASRSPLDYACLSGSLNVAIKLTERGAYVDQQKGKLPSTVRKQALYPASFFAAAGGNESLFHFLLKRGAVLDRIYGQISILHVAIYFNQLAFADMVLHKGLSPDIGSEKISPLQLASKEGNLKAVQLLLDYGAGVISQFGEISPLHYAATYGASGVVKELLSAGFPVNSMASVGTPLCCACRSGQYEIAKILIQKGATVNVNFDKTFGTPLHLASTYASPPFISLLLSHGANIESTTQNGKTLLHCAAEAGNLELTKLLIGKGLRVNAITKTGRTPLHDAAEGGHFVLVRYLVENAGADVMVKEVGGKTARQMAAGGMGKETGKYLQANETIRGAGKGATSISLVNLGLETIPSQLMTLTNLQTIDLRNNKIQSIPQAITSLSDLTTLKLAGNPLELVPKQAIDEKGKASVVLSFLKNLEEANHFWTKVKLMVVGREAVGKTSLFRALRGSEKNLKLDQRGDTVSTEGIDISELRIGDIDFSGWDFGGQEVFYPAHTFFLTKKAVYLILFNILDDDLSSIEYWIRLIKATTNQASPLLLVATHSDTISSQETLEQRLAVVRERFWGYKNVHCVLAVSSVTKEGLDEFCEQLTKVVRESGIFKQKVPGSYLLLERQIDFLRKKRPTLSWIEFLEVARNYGISTEQGAKRACRFFHDVGVLLHYDDSRSQLSDIVILDPQWLANVMSRLVSFRTENKIRDGVLSYAKLCGIWHEFSEDLRLKFLLLLERFQIAHRMRPQAYSPNMGSLKADDFNPQNPPPKGGSPEEKHALCLRLSMNYDIVVPSLLPAEPPSRKKLETCWPKLGDTRVGTDEYRRFYQFDFLPLGLFGRIIVRMMNIGVAYPVKWREGIILMSNYHHEGSFITFHPKVYQLRINHRVYHHRGKHPSHSLFTQIIFAIDSLLEGYYPGLSQTAQRLIPCRHCYMQKGGESQGDASTFTFEECSAAIRRENPFVLCQTGKKRVRLNVAYLAPDIALLGLRQVTGVEIVGKIGEGGFGTVYKGKMGEKFVAVKELKEEMGEGEGEGEQFQEFQRECFMMSKLDHPNLVKFYGVWMCPFVRMVMEYVPCGDLMGLLESQWEGTVVEEFAFFIEGSQLEVNMSVGTSVYLEVEDVEKRDEEGKVMIQMNEQRGKAPLEFIELKKKKPLPDEEIPLELRLKILYDIAKGMEYLQNMVPPIIHRDLRSPNIFLVSTNPNSKITAKVADFGLSRLVETKIGGSLGTWQWLAPEVINTETLEYDERSDVYSFGMVCYEVFARKIPFCEYYEQFLRNGHFNKWGCIAQIINDHLRPTLPSTVPGKLRRLIEQCWSSEPSARPSFGIIVSTLKDLMKEKSMTLTEEIEETADTDEEFLSQNDFSIHTRYSYPLRIQLSAEDGVRKKPVCLSYHEKEVIVGFNKSSIGIFSSRGTLLKTLKLPVLNMTVEVRALYIVSGVLMAMGNNGVFYLYSVEGWDFLGQSKSVHTSVVRCSVLVEKEDGKTLLVTADVAGLICIRRVKVKGEGEISVTRPLDLVDVGSPIVSLSALKMKKETNIIAGGALGDLYLFSLFPFELLNNVEKVHGGSRVTGVIGVPATEEIWTGGNNGSMMIWKTLPTPKESREEEAAVSSVQYFSPFPRSDQSQSTPQFSPPKGKGSRPASHLATVSSPLLKNPSSPPLSNNPHSFTRTKSDQVEANQKSRRKRNLMKRLSSYSPKEKETLKEKAPTLNKSPTFDCVGLEPGSIGGHQEVVSLGRPLRKLGSMMWVLVETINSHKGRINNFCIVKSGLVCSASFDRTVRFWDPVSRVCTQELSVHEDSVTCVVSTPESSFWTGSLDESLCLWTENEARQEPCDSSFVDQLNDAYKSQHRNPSVGTGGVEGEVGTEVRKEDLTLEERIEIIDRNIAGLKEMNRSHVMDMKKATQLCNIILKDLKEAMAMAQSADESVIMSNLEDRITITLIEKKQLHSKTALNSAAEEGKITKVSDEKTPLGDALGKFEASITHFYEGLRVALESYENDFRKMASPRLCFSIFRNMIDIHSITRELREELKDLKARENGIRDSKKLSPDDRDLAKASKMAPCLKKFFQEFVGHLDTFISNHQAGIVALQLCFYRPSLAAFLLEKRDAVGRSIEDLLEFPHSFMRHSPFLLGVITEHLPMDSEPFVLIQSLVWDVRTKLWELNQARVANEIEFSLQFRFWPRYLDIGDSKLFGKGECLLKSSSVFVWGGGESTITSQQRSLFFYIFETKLVLVTQVCGKMVKEFQRGVSFTPSSSIFKWEDVPEVDNQLTLYFRVTPSSLYCDPFEDLWEKWVLILPSHLIKSNLTQAFGELTRRNALREVSKGEKKSRSKSIPVAQRRSPECAYVDTFRASFPNEPPLTEEVHILPLFEDLYTKSSTSVLNFTTRCPVNQRTPSPKSKRLKASRHVSRYKLKMDDLPNEDDEAKFRQALKNITSTLKKTMPSSPVTQLAEPPISDLEPPLSPSIAQSEPITSQSTTTFPPLSETVVFPPPHSHSQPAFNFPPTPESSSSSFPCIKINDRQRVKPRTSKSKLGQARSSARTPNEES